MGTAEVGGTAESGEELVGPLLFTRVTTPTERDLYEVATNGESFVAVGAEATILASDDGTVKRVAAPFTRTPNLNSVIWIGDKYLAGGDYGVMTTSDRAGQAWTRIADAWPATRTTAAPSVRALAYNNGVYAAATSAPTGGGTCGTGGALVTSRDLATWSVQSICFTWQPTNNYRAVAPNDNGFIAAGGLTYMVETYSDTGTFSHDVSGPFHWELTRALPEQPETVQDLRGISADGPAIVAVGARTFAGVSYANLYVSSEWRAPRLPSSWGALYAVTWSGEQFIAVGARGLIITSPDGVTWTRQTSGTTRTLRGVAAAKSGTLAGKIYVVGDAGVILVADAGGAAPLPR